MREVCFLIGENDAVLWSDASVSPIALPDSRARWEAIWSRRAALVEIAHSHPVGPNAFSAEDESTMAALRQALGRELWFSVVAPGEMIRRIAGGDAVVHNEPWWAALLRSASGMKSE
ncbi:MAG: Mov34/MPN/PAD-1 family protein [Deltaproteobacteria bacterium]|nr:Mov34/MPN/PAD-1 family protein [Deltaproteobacteria bacterium]